MDRGSSQRGRLLRLVVTGLPRRATEPAARFPAHARARRSARSRGANRDARMRCSGTPTALGSARRGSCIPSTRGPDYHSARSGMLTADSIDITSSAKRSYDGDMRGIADCVCERCGGSYQALVVGNSRLPTYFDGPNPCTCTTADWVRDAMTRPRMGARLRPRRSPSGSRLDNRRTSCTQALTRQTTPAASATARVDPAIRDAGEPRFQDLGSGVRGRVVSTEVGIKPCDGGWTLGCPGSVAMSVWPERQAVNLAAVPLEGRREAGVGPDG